jgi:hypothetical protein
VVLLHIGADHLGYLPLILALGVVIFIAATALRTKLERMAAGKAKHPDDEPKDTHADSRRND